MTKNKVFLLGLTFLAGSAALAMGEDDLVMYMREVFFRVRQDASYLSPQDRQEIRERLQDIDTVVRDGSGGRPSGSTCLASCTRTDQRTPDSNYSAAGSGATEIEARQAASEAARNTHHCAWGVVVQECSPVYPGRIFDALATCTNTDQHTPDSKYLTLGRADSVTGAKAAAMKAVKDTFHCAWGTVVTAVSDRRSRPNFCVAACTSTDGKTPDSKYTKGANGDTEVEAQYNAVKSTRDAFHCAWGIVVTQCEERR